MRDFFDRLRPYPILRAGLVNLKSGTVFRGVIWRQRGRFTVLRDAVILSDRGTKVDGGSKVDGEVLVMRDDIDFIQVVS